MDYSLTRSISISHPLINFKWRFSLRIFWILGFISILGLLVFYIYQVNSLTREVFLIEAYKKKREELSENNEILEISLAKSSSLENIEDYLKTHNFEKASKPKYIRILESSVATKAR
jgi:hypothetical protein